MLRVVEITRFECAKQIPPQPGSIILHITNASHTSFPNIGATVQTALSLRATLTFCKQMIQLISLIGE